MSVQITIFGEDAGHALRELGDFAVGLRGRPDFTGAVAVETRTSQAAASENIITNEGQTAVPQRERGKPAPGRARRTKEEIVEDEAADKADAERNDAAKEAGIQADAASDVKPAISTGGGRNHPDDPPENPQDAADEAAEVEANRNDAKPLTHDDVKAALGEYLKQFGMPAAQEDGPKVIKLAMGSVEAPPNDAGEPQAWRISLIPDDQTALRKVLDGVTEMLAKNPFKREPVNSVMG